MADIQILNTIVDANNWINMQGVVFTPGYKRMNEANPIVGNQNSTLPEGDRIGVEVPVITVRGVINVDDFADTDELWSETPSTLASTGEDGTSNTSRITIGYLNALWRENSGQTKLKIYFGNPDSQKQWKNWDNSSTELYVVIDDFTFQPGQDSEGLHIVTYSIVCREVQADGAYTS